MLSLDNKSSLYKYKHIYKNISNITVTYWSSGFFLDHKTLVFELSIVYICVNLL